MTDLFRLPFVYLLERGRGKGEMEGRGWWKEGGEGDALCIPTGEGENLRGRVMEGGRERGNKREKGNKRKRRQICSDNR